MLVSVEGAGIVPVAGWLAIGEPIVPVAGWLAIGEEESTGCEGVCVCA